MWEPNRRKMDLHKKLADRFRRSQEWREEQLTKCLEKRKFVCCDAQVSLMRPSCERCEFYN